MSKKNEIPTEIQALADKMAPHVVAAKTEYRFIPGVGNVYDLHIGLNGTPFSGPVEAACIDLEKQFRAMGARIEPICCVSTSILTKGSYIEIAPFKLLVPVSFKDRALLKAFTKAIKKAKGADRATPSSRVSATAPVSKPAL